MKKWCWAFLFIFLPVFAHADLLEPQEDRSYTLKYNLSLTSALQSTSTVVIHLASGTKTGIFTEWPHYEDGEVNISDLRMEIDKVATSTVAVRLGVITSVNLSSGSVTWFWSKNFQKNVSNTDTGIDISATETVYRCRVNASTQDATGTRLEGTTPYIISNDKIALAAAGSTVYQTDVVLPSPASTGATFPGRGDIVMDVVKDTTNAIDIHLELKYYTRRR